MGKEESLKNFIRKVKSFFKTYKSFFVFISLLVACISLYFAWVSYNMSYKSLYEPQINFNILNSNKTSKNITYNSSNLEGYGTLDFKKQKFDTFMVSNPRGGSAILDSITLEITDVESLEPNYHMSAECVFQPHKLPGEGGAAPASPIIPHEYPVELKRNKKRYILNNKRFTFDKGDVSAYKINIHPQLGYKFNYLYEINWWGLKDNQAKNLTSKEFQIKNRKHIGAEDLISSVNSEIRAYITKCPVGMTKKILKNAPQESEIQIITKETTSESYPHYLPKKRKCM